jgi:hypothetical protein
MFVVYVPLVLWMSTKILDKCSFPRIDPTTAIILLSAYLYGWILKDIRDTRSTFWTDTHSPGREMRGTMQRG